MHELYRVLSAISADTFSQHFRTYFIIPCNPTFYKHLKLLRRPEWNADIRTVRARQGLNIEKRAIHRMTLFSISLRARDVAERPGDVRLRRPQRSGDIRTVRARQGLNIEKRAIHRMTLFSISLRARDVAERPGDVRLRRPQRSGDIRTVRARQGLNIEKRAIHRMTLFSISLRARDGIRTRDPRLGKAILHH